MSRYYRMPLGDDAKPAAPTAPAPRQQARAKHHKKRAASPTAPNEQSPSAPATEQASQRLVERAPATGHGLLWVGLAALGVGTLALLLVDRERP